VQVVRAAALNFAEDPTDFLAMLLILEQVHIPLTYVPAVDMAVKAVASMLYLAVIIAVQ
jgi:hypothetical protein